MRRRHDKSTLADPVANLAVDPGPVGGIVGDTATVLLVLGVAKQDSAGDLVAVGGAEVADGGGNQGGSLAIEGLVKI